MGKSRSHRSKGEQRRREFSDPPPLVLPSLWQRAQCCGATIAADPGRMRKDWADVHEPGCRVPWDALGLAGEPCAVYPGSPYAPAGTWLRAVNRRPGSQPARPGHAAAYRRVPQ